MDKRLIKNDTLKIIQISDTHLFADDSATLFGINSNQKFNELINQICKTELDDTDLILLTGDLSQDESKTSYEKIVNMLDPLNIPVYWIPGNHDNLINIETVFKTANNFFKSRKLSTTHWNFIFLNTKLEGTDDGFLSPTELETLKYEISKLSDNKHVAIVMHHHPTEVNTPLIDKYVLRNNKEFWDLLANSPVKLIICGHVHGDYQLKHNQIHIETSPASCFQFPKQSIELKTENKIGYKVYQLDTTGFTAEAKCW